jgi:large subunit ribosomal protein L30
MAKLKVTQTGSPIGRPSYQEKNLVALGLNKLHRTRLVEDTPETRGRIAKVQHLVKVEAVDAPLARAGDVLLQGGAAERNFEGG